MVRECALAVLAVLAAASACPGQVPGCACSDAGTRLSCRGAGLQHLPPLNERLLALDVSNNNISALPADALLPATGLRDLSAEDNLISDIDPDVLSELRNLRVLRLARNRLTTVPAALVYTNRLQALNLAGNQIAELTAASLPPLPALHTLVLKRNRITYIEKNAFVNTPALRVLRLEDNLLSELPTAIHNLPMLEDLSLSGNKIERVTSGLQACPRLARLELRGNSLSQLHHGALENLPRLTTLILSEARGLPGVPSLNGTTRLRTLRMDHTRLRELPTNLCNNTPQLRALDLRSNLLTSVPDLHECSELRVLELSDNDIKSIGDNALKGLRKLHDLLLARNRLKWIPSDAFIHTPRLQLLDLEDNRIEHIDMEAFVPISKLEDLNVGNNVFPSLPASGLQRLLHLKAHNNPNLRRFHPPELFPRIQSLVLSYAYHCCEFLPLMDGAAGVNEEWAEREGFSDLVLLPPAHVDLAAWANATDIWPHYLNATGEGGSRLRAVGPWSGTGVAELKAGSRQVRCLPLPGPFLPCVDLFDWWTLRCGVWAVFLLALLGNGTVVFVLVFSRSRIDVPRFLVTNLAAADFFMGIYLGFLAVVDAGTLGEFRSHAISWQMSGCCRLAGFLGVLSSELSVYTLAVITLERNYAITHAMHLNKRLSLRHAAAVMAAGWAFSLTAASLPLLGVSDYRKFAVCLPFETDSAVSLGYVVSLLVINGLAFLVLLGCYLKMYCAIRGSQAWNSNDSRIAKRMALLVFTDFLCWSPIAFFALTAAFGAQLVSLEEAKVFTVFVLPLNSCCNPFLYAILTKQFKKDCALVCKAIEESRVTRGIGRCRHSSNFSNRQTPANTNSLAERSSRGQHGAACACRRLLPPGGAVVVSETVTNNTGNGSGEASGERLLRWLRACGRRATTPAPPAPRQLPAPPARAGSVSSSVEFSSSRSDSWRTYGRPPPPPRRAASWLVARKTSQDSNLSSSRNDSSGSNATASTGTWRTSRSGGSAATGTSTGSRPRLTRQPAVVADEPPASPSALPPPRMLHTIPSAAETELQPDDNDAR
ncbi:lutropin-choriogonadotropic hormone receptor isoform X2 [Leptidea sinapis]|uniref:lutropin-choriogonadotropic hormone receptor isoform X2 n=1 Tax=Leptidea sinapis TaxID=189913 RepID=UPI0021C4962C|nr:lutropin-choriogonadotropic hormone receptor isoform X2 [Leptidea sinapis]